MYRYLLYLLVVILTFGISVFVASNFYLENEENFVVVQQGEEITTAKIIVQKQSNAKQENDHYLSQSFDAINFNDLKIKGVGLDTPHSTILRKLGKPLQSKKNGIYDCTDDRKMTLQYSGLVIELISDDSGRNFSAASIEVTSSKWSVGSGISIGSDIKDVQAKFGQPYHKTKEFGLEQLHYGNGDGGVATFSFQENKLISISWDYNFC